MERDRNLSAAEEAAAGRQTGTAVIPFGQPRKAAFPGLGSVHPAAAFIAHLIAANENAPQLRVLRRGEPGAASAAYETAHSRAQQGATPVLQASPTLKIV